jgi:hypothetical protein
LFKEKNAGKAHMYQHFLMLCVSNLATNPHENLHVMNGLVEKSNSKLSKP